jgi:hypothetical protein
MDIDLNIALVEGEELQQAVHQFDLNIIPGMQTDHLFICS